MQKNNIYQGDAAQLLTSFQEQSVDLVVTYPPYLVNYKDRTGRRIANDTNPEAVLSVFAPLARVMKQNSYAVCFAGWSALPQFAAAWEAAGLKIVSQIIWQKSNASRHSYTQYRHESAYVLAKGNPVKPRNPLPSVMEWVYSGNRRHPTEKAVEIIAPLVRSFSKPEGLICDPFSGSGSTSVAAALNNRDYIGIDIDPAHVATARARLAGVTAYQARRKERNAA